VARLLQVLILQLLFQKATVNIKILWWGAIPTFYNMERV